MEVPFALPLVTFAAFWLLLCPVAWAAHRLFGPSLAAIAPAQRSSLLFALAMLPIAIAVLVAVLGFAPAIGGVIVDGHCHPQTGCGAHVPMLHADAAHAVVLGIVLAVAAGTWLWSVVNRLRRSLRFASSLTFLAERAAPQRFEVIQSAEAFAYCVGLLWPKVVVSQGLLDRLSPVELKVVVDHEEAHAARRDNLRHWLAGLALSPLPRALRQPLLGDLALTSEHACDHAAAAASGPERVIDALALTHASGTRRAGATFDAGTQLDRRIDALRAAPRYAPGALAVRSSIALVYAAHAVLATSLAHHATELVLDWLA